jgi:hypothetical protein
LEKLKKDNKNLGCDKTSLEFEEQTAHDDMEKYSFTVVKSSEEIELEKRLQNKEREVNRMRDKTTDLKLNMNDP